MKRAFPIVLLALTCAACVPAPVKRALPTSDTVPERWAATDTVAAGGNETGEARGEWWTGFESPHLDDVVRQALNGNYDLQAAAARLVQAEAQARIAGAELKPQVSGSLNANRSKQIFIGIPIPGSTPGQPASATATTLGVSFGVSWEPDLWGRIRAGARAAVADFEAAAADLEAARLSLAAGTAKAYFRVTEATQQLALAETSAESFRRTAEQVRARYASGVRTAVDLRLALNNLARAEALIEQRRAELDAQTRNLETLLGRYPSGALRAAGSLPDLPPPVPAGLPADLVGRRPDLVAAERRLRAADERIVAARRALYPSLNLTGNTGTTSSELDDLLNGDFSVWSLVAGLTQPIFQGGRLRANVALNAAAAEQAVATYASAVLAAYSEVETTLAAESFLAEQEAHTRESAEQARAAQELSEERYRRGLTGYITVLESQRSALNAETELLSIRRRRLENRIDLHLALGGGFAASPATPPLQTAQAVKKDPAS